MAVVELSACVLAASLATFHISKNIFPVLNAGVVVTAVVHGLGVAAITVAELVTAITK